MSMTFLSMQKEYFQFRGEIQNDTIIGVNSDEKTLAKKLLNEEMRDLVRMKPPFLGFQWHLRLQASVALQASSLDSVTGSKNRPWINDSGTNLNTRDLYRVVTNGTHRHTVIGVTGTTYNLDTALFATATTAQSWIAYKEHYPLPHNSLDIVNVFYEDGEKEIDLGTRDQFFEAAKRGNDESRPLIASLNVFVNEYEDYKNLETAVTVASGSRAVTVADATIYDLGDVALFTGNHIHTIQGVSTTAGQIWLDRSYAGTTTIADLTLNPKNKTNYISFYRYPNTEKDVIVNGWLKPEDMVADTDVCPFDDDIARAIVIGALMRDKIGRETLTEQWIGYYEKMRSELMHKKEARTHDNVYPGLGRQDNRADRYSGPGFE
jgi:hypothetical protein